MKNKLSFLSGLMAVLLVFSPFATNATYVHAAESEENATVEAGVRDVVYFENNSTKTENSVSNNEKEEITVDINTDLLDKEEIDYRTIKLDYSDKKNLKLRFLKEDLIKVMNDRSLTIEVNKGNVEFEFTLYSQDVWKYLDQDLILTISETSNSEAVSPTYGISLTQSDGTETPDIWSSYGLTVDKSNVNNWDNLFLYYFDENGNKDFNNPVKRYFDSETGQSGNYGFIKNGVKFAIFEDDFHSVTDNVYDTWAPWAWYPEVSDEGTIQFDYQIGQSDLRVLIGDTQKEYLSDILNSDPDKRITLDKENVSIELPLNLFDIELNAYFKIYENYIENAIGPVFDISYQKFDKTFITGSKDDSMKLKVKINPSDITNWDNLVLYNIDNGKKVYNSAIKAIKYDAKTGEVWFEIPQLGTYGVFEEASSGNKPTPKPTPKPEESDEEDVVTDEVYEAVTYLSEHSFDKNKNITLDYTEKTKNTKKLTVDLLTDEVAELLKSNPKATVIVKKGNVDVEIPLALLNVDGDVTFTVVEGNHKDALGLVFDFKLQKADGSYISEFGDTPITVKGIVDPSKVKKWNDVAAYFIDENGKVDYANPIKIKYDAKTGEVSFEVTHFSTYGVFEVAGSGDAATPGTSDESDNDGAKAGAKDDSTNGDGKTAATESGKKLPATATNGFNMLAIGILLILTGGITLIVRKRKEQTA